MYDQAKGVIGRMQLGRTSPSSSSGQLPHPVQRHAGTEDVLTVISGTERGRKLKSLSDVQNLAPMERFLAVLKVYLDMEALRAERAPAAVPRRRSSFPR